MEKYVDYETFLRLMERTLRAVITVQADIAAIRDALLESNALPLKRYVELRTKMLKEFDLTSGETATEADGEKLMELLRKFEGPIQ